MECPSKHESSSEVLISYVEGSLSPGKVFAFERHLEVCEQCREITAAQRELWNALDSWMPTQISKDFDQRLYQRIAKDDTAESGLSWDPPATWRRAMPMAAACAALMVGFLLHTPSSEVNISKVDETVATPGRGPQFEQVESALEDFEMLRQLEFHSITGSVSRKRI
jgi:anti-sigma factor RsiW